VVIGKGCLLNPKTFWLHPRQHPLRRPINHFFQVFQYPSRGALAFCPLAENVPFYDQFNLANLQSVIPVHLAPLICAEGTVLTGIAHLFKPFNTTSHIFIIRQHVIFDHEHSASLEYAAALFKKLGSPAKMVRSHAAGDKIKHQISKRQLFSIRIFKNYIVGSTLSGEIACSFQHSQHDIRSDHFFYEWGELESSVSAASCNIQNNPITLRLSEVYQALQFWGLSMRSAAHISLRKLIEAIPG